MKKNYVAPAAEFVVFAPTQTLAASEQNWFWGQYDTENNTVSKTATIDVWKAPWKYDDGSDAY